MPEAILLEKARLALELASAAMDEDPDHAGNPIHRSHARYLAYDALRIAFPAGDPRWLAQVTGFGFVTERDAERAVGRRRDAAWWNDDLVDEIVGALVADQYGDQAA